MKNERLITALHKVVARRPYDESARADKFKDEVIDWVDDIAQDLEMTFTKVIDKGSEAFIKAIGDLHTKYLKEYQSFYKEYVDLDDKTKESLVNRHMTKNLRKMQVTFQLMTSKAKEISKRKDLPELDILKDLTLLDFFDSFIDQKPLFD